MSVSGVKLAPNAVAVVEPAYDPLRVLIARVIADLPPIGKTEKNRDQHYNFRGIESVKEAVRPRLVAHGVFYTPEVLSVERSTYSTSKGTVMQSVQVTMAFTWHGPAGDTLRAVTCGEGSDVADKGTNKAMSAAEKYMLLQTLCIADGQDEGDAETPEGPAPRQQNAAPRIASSTNRAPGNGQGGGSRPAAPARSSSRSSSDERNEYSWVNGAVAPTHDDRAKRASPAQIKRLFAIGRNVDLDPHDAVEALWPGLPVDELDWRQYKWLTEALEDGWTLAEVGAIPASEDEYEGDGRYDSGEEPFF